MPLPVPILFLSEAESKGVTQSGIFNLGQGGGTGGGLTFGVFLHFYIVG